MESQNLQTLIPLFASALICLLAVKWVFFKVLKLAKLKNLVDNPDARKFQKEPVPVMGGLAVFFGLIVGLAFASTMIDCISLYPIVLAGSIMFFVGMLDDFLGLTPKNRITIEIFTILCLIFGSGLGINNLMGLWGIYSMPYWVMLILTVFAGVGIINAINMIDGVNGLSSGLCIMVSLLFSVIFWYRSDYANCLLGLCMAFSLGLFLLHNVFGAKSKMFIGDSGTMLMGIIVLWFVINLLDESKNQLHMQYRPDLNLTALALAIESVPVFDTLRVMCMRMYKGKSPFSPDRNHLHHIFVDNGISHSITALSEILINFLIVMVTFGAYRLGASLEMQLYITIIVGILFVWCTYWFLVYQMNHNTRFSKILSRFSIASHLGHKEWWLRFSAYLDNEE